MHSDLKSVVDVPEPAWPLDGPSSDVRADSPAMAGGSPVDRTDANVDSDVVDDARESDESDDSDDDSRSSDSFDPVCD